MDKYANEDALRRLLKRKARKMSRAELAKEIGVSAQMLSMLLNDRYPFTGKAVEYLGYQKVRETLFEKVES